ncbi:SDR family oxidoreductase [Prosthecochloris sp.]|uniref:SDR family NAD(P)-dependent oxidoreductase n=1 Tax=Prosthecochloris sp. TaxID=290513 RepID=UPI00257B154D|nr:SDR family oxidoreductase [Prosthecochloris sp.]
MSTLSVVITGGTRGIGFGLAKRFLEKGCKVTICGTSTQSVRKAVHELAAFGESAAGTVADVGKRSDVESLLDVAVKKFGAVDIWVNNAGITHDMLNVWELEQATIEDVLRVNMLGVVNGTVVPFLEMQKQGRGKIFNMEGLGSDGFMMEGLSVYGTSKSALRYFTRAFANEAGSSPVQVGTLSPGMVVTDLLLETLHGDSPETRKKRKFYNIMADDVDTVTAFLCEKMVLSTASSPRIEWLTKPKVIARMLLAPFRRRELFNGKSED